MLYNSKQQDGECLDGLTSYIGTMNNGRERVAHLVTIV